MATIGKLLQAYGRRLFRPRGFARDQRGTTAIEFGLLAVPFFALLAAILETSYVFLVGQILDTAVQDSARFIRTGQVQAANYDLAGFRAEICTHLYSLFDCSKLRINIQPVTNFTTASVSSPLGTTCANSECNWTLAETFNPGTGASGTNVILVRVYYQWPTLVSLAGFDLSNTGSRSRLLGSVRVFANEPF